MGISDIFNKERYLLEVYYDGTWIFDMRIPITGQLFHKNDKRKIAFLIPKDLKPTIKGHLHRIEYDIRDAAPMGELYKICPDLVNEIDSRFRKIIEHPDFEQHKTQDAEFIIKEPITDLFDDPTPPQQSVIPAPKPGENATLKALHEYFTNHKESRHLFLAWQWGYIQKEGWYLRLQDPPIIEQVAFPKKIEQLGVHPGVFHNILSSTFIADIVRRKEPEWAWLKEIILPFLIIVGFLFFVYLIVSHM